MSYIFHSLSGFNILIAEDNTAIQKISADLINTWGATATIVGNGKEAIDFLEKNKYDLLLLDHQMPKLNGMDTAQFIRKQMENSNRDIIILAMSGDGFNENQLSNPQILIDDFIEKPFSADLLHLKIYSLLNKKTIDSINENKQNLKFNHINFNHLIEHTGNSKKFLIQIVSLLIETFNESSLLMEKALLQKNYTLLKDHAHKLKPHMLMIGNKILAETLNDIEIKAGEKDDMHSISNLFQKARFEMKMAIADLDTILHSDD